MEIKALVTWNGKKLDDMTKEELLAALVDTDRQLQVVWESEALLFNNWPKDFSLPPAILDCWRTLWALFAVPPAGYQKEESKEGAICAGCKLPMQGRGSSRRDLCDACRYRGNYPNG